MSNKPIKVLLIEDNPGDARLIREMLIEGRDILFDLECADRLSTGLKHLAEGSIDVVLLDLSLPDSDGLDTFDKAHARAASVPIIVLTGFDDEALAVKAVRKGAQDYLVKGQVDDNLLGRAIRYAIERNRAEEQIRASLKEKEVLLREIHHRVKNNLQIISSLLSLQSRNIKNKETLEVFNESQNRIRTMALIHEELYQSKDLAKIDFAEYVRSLATYLFRSYEVNSTAINLKIDVDDVSLDIDTAIPCGLIINELVSNSLKHAFPEGIQSHPENRSKEGEIRIDLRSDNDLPIAPSDRTARTDNKFTLIVSDNGVGFPDLNFRNTESLGLRLVNALTNQLGGTIELDRSSGTEFKITFAESL